MVYLLMLVVVVVICNYRSNEHFHKHGHSTTRQCKSYYPATDGDDHSTYFTTFNSIRDTNKNRHNPDTNKRWNKGSDAYDKQCA
jgi:hypothetical protein